MRSVLHLTRREIALLIGIVTALHTWLTWGALDPVPTVPDEISYILQAKIFASGHWVAASPPSEPAFQQSHALVTPVLASKYPPGFALLLTPGALVGIVWLIPVVLAGIAGAVLFLLITEYAPVWAAVCGWAYWLSDPLALRFRAGYYSESVSGLTWLLAWWLLGRWKSTHSRRDLVWLSVAVGWCAITRPFTAIALAVPLAIYLLNDLVRRRAWRDIAAAALASMAVVCILPIANYMTTGSATKTAFSLYADEYLPVDKLGFHLDSTPPRFPLAAPNADTYKELRATHVDHVPAKLPSIAWIRLRELSSLEWSEWRVLFVPLIVAGLWELSVVPWLAIACGAALFVSYLDWAHWHGWSIYYYEALPIFALTVANGLRVLTRRIPHTRATFGVATALAVLYCAGVVRTTTQWRRFHVESAQYSTDFHAALKDLPFSGAVVFIRYADNVYPHIALVNNSPTWQRDSVWVVNSWGPSADLRLLSASGQRVPLLFDEKTRLISMYRELLDSLSRPARGR